MLKRLMAAALSIIALTQIASAADIPVKAPPLAPTPVFSWTGFYVGANMGGGWASRSVQYTANDPASFGATCLGFFGGSGCVPPGSFHDSGVIGGLQAGYNWQFASNLLGGLEADLDGAGLSGGPSSSAVVLGGACCNFSNFRARENIDWFGTVRARLGLLPTNALLVYGTGGFAYGRVHDDVGLDIANAPGVPGVVIGGFGFACTTPVGCFAGSSSRIATGWTAGGGFEYALSQNVSFKTEYLYVNLGHGAGVNAVAQGGSGAVPSSFTVTYGRLDFNVVRLGLNWKL